LYLDYLALGNPTLDVQPQASPALGGSVVYSAVQAARLGFRAAILGRADAVAFESYWRPHAREVQLYLQPSGSITTFYNAPARDSREQWLRAWSGPISHADPLPDSKILHIAPVAQEIVLEKLFTNHKSFLVCLTPQGLLRKWNDADRHISLVRRGFSRSIAMTIDIVVVSEIEAEYTRDLLMGVAKHGGLSVVTHGSRGGEVLTRDDCIHFSAFPAEKVVDTTGAGDCFAATLAVWIHQGRPLRQAIRAGAIAASLCVRGRATTSVGTKLQIEQILTASI
jgi:1D-myo-inositol 3-kinase